jgi:flagellar biosynthesis GTPase FlhF
VSDDECDWDYNGTAQVVYKPCKEYKQYKNKFFQEDDGAWNEKDSDTSGACGYAYLFHFPVATIVTVAEDEQEEDLIDFGHGYDDDVDDDEEEEEDEEEEVQEEEEEDEEEEDEEEEEDKEKMEEGEEKVVAEEEEDESEDKESGPEDQSDQQSPQIPTNPDDYLLVDMLICFHCGVTTSLPDVYWSEKTTNFFCSVCLRKNSGHMNCEEFGCQASLSRHLAKDSKANESVCTFQECQNLASEFQRRLIVEYGLRVGGLTLAEEDEEESNLEPSALCSTTTALPLKQPKKFVLASAYKRQKRSQ